MGGGWVGDLFLFGFGILGLRHLCVLGTISLFLDSSYQSILVDKLLHRQWRGVRGGGGGGGEVGL